MTLLEFRHVLEKRGRPMNAHASRALLRQLARVKSLPVAGAMLRISLVIGQCTSLVVGPRI